MAGTRLGLVASSAIAEIDNIYRFLNSDPIRELMIVVMKILTDRDFAIKCEDKRGTCGHGVASPLTYHMMSLLYPKIINDLLIIFIMSYHSLCCNENIHRTYI